MAKEKSLIWYWAETQLYYRQPRGDKAWEKIREMIGRQHTSSFAFLTGWLQGASMEGSEGISREKLMKLQGAFDEEKVDEKSGV